MESIYTAGKSPTASLTISPTALMISPSTMPVCFRNWTLSLISSLFFPYISIRFRLYPARFAASVQPMISGVINWLVILGRISPICMVLCWRSTFAK